MLQLRIGAARMIGVVRVRMWDAWQRLSPVLIAVPAAAGAATAGAPARLADLRRAAATPRGQISLAVAGIGLLVIALAILVSPPDRFRTAGMGADTAAAVRAGLPFDPEKLSASDPRMLEALKPEEAVASNAARPISTLPNPAARSFVVPLGEDGSYERSLDCMTAAIYYEAAVEPLDGQRAVAQVVLNRMRHPLYPHTVCGVVFQGSERSTGCQFTFTCDGALARPPVTALWTRAREVAASALAGFVYRPVGLATHYHADYVVPYWADSLIKTYTVGRHIFYRIAGGYGSPAAFNRGYAGDEPLLFQRTAAGQFALSSAEAAELVVSAGQPATADRPVLDIAGKVLFAAADGRAALGAPATSAKPATGAGPGTAPGSSPAGGTAMLRADHPAKAAPTGARAVQGAAERRWIIGMDGASRPGEQAQTGAEAARPSPEKAARGNRDP